MRKCALRGSRPLALPLVGVAIRPDALRCRSLAKGLVPPQVFPLLPVGVGCFLQEDITRYGWRWCWL